MKSAALVAWLLATVFRAVAPEHHPHHLRLPARQVRQLQNGLWQAQYVAQFMQLIDETCNSPDPVVRVYCLGTIEVMDTSDPLIICDRLSEEELAPIEDFNAFECTVPDCGVGSNTNCDEIYLGSDDFIDGPWAEIYFSCEGTNVTQVDGAISFEDRGNGTCAEPSGTFGNTRSFHALRMGVSCPVTPGSDDRFFDFDQYPFECGYWTYPFGQEPTNEIVCAHGNNCGGEACEYDHEWVTIDADPTKFNEGCVGIPIRSSTAQFQTSWALLVEDNGCIGTDPTIRITCPNSIIELIETTHGTTSCTGMGTAVMECRDSGTSFINQFSGVSFECTSREETPPPATIEYLEDTATCSGIVSETPVLHALQFGIYCEDEEGDLFLTTSDVFMDCGRDHQISYLNEDGENFGDIGDRRFTCSVQSSFATDGTQSVPLATMSTDVSWNVLAAPCYANATTLVQATLPPTPAPSLVEETTPAPSLIVPATPGEPLSTTESGSSASTGAIVGGVVGGVAILSIVAMLVFFRMRSKPSADEASHARSKTVDTSADSPATPSSPTASHAMEDPSHVTATTNEVGPVQTSSPRESNTTSYLPNFKDQARSARVVPMATAMPLEYESKPPATPDRFKQLEP